MQHEEFNWKSSDNITHFGQLWKSDSDNNLPVICLVHGMGEHSSRYNEFAKYFTEKGISVISYDQRGHGKSEGKRGHTPSLELLLESIDKLLEKAKEKFPNKPLILYGHSMGGGIVLHYVLKNKPQLFGVIASSPWLKLAFEPPAIKVELGKIVNNFFPSFSQSTELDHTAISRDPDVVEQYMNDSLVHDTISSNMFLSVKEATQWALDHAAVFSLPLLVFHGSEDTITSHQASEDFVAKIEKNATFKLWEGYYHECHNDKGKTDVLNYINAWIEQQIEIKAHKEQEEDL